MISQTTCSRFYKATTIATMIAILGIIIAVIPPEDNPWPLFAKDELSSCKAGEVEDEESAFRTDFEIAALEVVTNGPSWIITPGGGVSTAMVGSEMEKLKADAGLT